MKMAEDVKKSLRAIRRRPVESLLLVIGIALGIGATAAGILMINDSVREQNAILDSTQYKEIVIQEREESEDMELPALLSEEGEGVILSWADLDAKYDVSEIEYAYLADAAEFRLAAGDFRTAGGQDSAAPPAFEIPEIEGPEPALDAIAGLRASPEYFTAWSLTAGEGSLFTQQEMEDGDPVMVVGATLGETLFEDGVALGKELAVFQTIYTIVGVLEPTGTPADETAVVPVQAADVAGSSDMGRAMQDGGATLHSTVY